MPRHVNQTSFKKGDPRLIGNKFAEGHKATEKQKETLKKVGIPFRFKKGTNPWNTGKTRKEETKRKISLKLKKKYESNELKSNGGAKFQGFRITNHRMSTFKKMLMKETKKCEECGFDNPYTLVLHHIDCNKGNNLRNNLKILCANCHYIAHKGFRKKKGDQNTHTTSSNHCNSK